MISVCVLSYNRPDFLAASLTTLRAAAQGVELEILVGDDGSTDPNVRPYLISQLEMGAISALVLAPPGQNEGVGRMVNRLWGMASGDVVAKADQDLVYHPGALATVEALAGGGFCTVGGFRYWTDPVDHRKMLLDEGPDYAVVEDYVSSFIAVSRSTYEKVGAWPEHSAAFAEDIEWKRSITEAGGVHLLPAQDVMQNVGFGIGPSTVVVGEGKVQEIKAGPRTFGVTA